MGGESDLMARASQNLRSAGYPLVVSEMRLPFTRSVHRLDVVAFGADSTGALQPTVVVEIKQSAAADPQRVLDQLAFARDILGTRRHYLFTRDGWLEADSGLRHLHSVDGPAEPDRPGGELRDVATAEVLFQQRLWAADAGHRGEVGPDAALYAVRTLLSQLSGQAGSRAQDQVPINAVTRWRAARDVIRRYLVRDRRLEPLLSQRALARPLALLLGELVPERVEDPFAGLGTFLWAVADRAMDASGTVDLSGTDINAKFVELAAAVGQLCPTPLQFYVGDSFRTQEREPVDAVITQPPLGLRLAEPFQLSSGTSTRDGELAAIDVAINRLKPGGRAVLHVSRGWTWRGGDAARYRRYLASQWRVAALIGLPAGAYVGTAIPSMILVVDRAEPGETFVAQLESSWAEELAPGSAVLDNCLEHLRARYTPGSVGGQGE